MTKLKYLGTKGTNKNFIHEEIKYILNSIQLATITFMNFCLLDNTFINIFHTFNLQLAVRRALQIITYNILCFGMVYKCVRSYY